MKFKVILLAGCLFLSTSAIAQTSLEDRVKRLESELSEVKTILKKEIDERDEKIRNLTEELNARSAAAAPAPVQAAAVPAQPIRVAAGNSAYMNISLDSLIDAGTSSESSVDQLETGDHDPRQRGFTVPNEEIVFDGAVDPYFKGVANLVFKLDKDNNTDVELEEAYFTTSSLPANLQLKGGQFFTEFGRLNQQHPHAWDFVDQPLVIGRMFGPEGMRNPGARLSWLLPTPFYSELFLTAQDSQGDTAYSFRNGNELFGRPPVDRQVHSPGDLILTPRLTASFDLSDSQTLVLGTSAAFGPNSSGNDTYTQILGTDLYWKWKPEWQSGGFPFVAFQMEALGRRYEAGSTVSAPELAPALPAETLEDWGLYAQAVYGFTTGWTTGLRGDWVDGDNGAFEPDPNRSERYRFSPDLTYYPTEFSKIRFQYNYDHREREGGDNSFWLQVEFLLGSHAAHKF